MAFEPGVTFIPASGQVIGDLEKDYMKQVIDSGWLTASKYNDEFEKTLQAFLGVKAVRTCNSGSSANLLAFSCLTSHELGDRAIKKGDEVITVACGFPTTINPIIQNGCVPVFLDINTTLNINTNHLEKALTSKTKAVMIAHALGNPFNMDLIAEFCRKHKLWLIEDCCDALGAKWRDRYVGTFGDVSTLSFFPAHHITMGEGGAVMINNPKLTRLVESFRDWGRDCWCQPGKDNTCGKRFCWKFENLPEGYDHKYVYTHVGYNLKITDIQAACGLAQLSQLPKFLEARKENYAYLKERLGGHEEIWLPSIYPDADPSWFGFPITINPEAGIERKDMVDFLADHQIGTRLLFAGNATKQPYMKNQEYRVVGDLKQSDLVMTNLFWIGVQPALTREMLDYTATTIENFLGHF
jgi:CDP-6-deoxy-D-xylo-4-hexulose-3-dehydrase